MEGDERKSSGGARVSVRSGPLVPHGRTALPGEEVNRLLARNVPDGELLDDLRFPADLTDESLSVFGRDWS